MGQSPGTREEAAYMRMRQGQNLVQCDGSRAEAWMHAKLLTTGHTWTRQAQSGWRLFDFWCHKIGVAVEVDGPEHDADRDRKRDAEVKKRRAIAVLRVRNFNESDAAMCLFVIAKAKTWNARRASAGLKPVKGAE